MIIPKIITTSTFAVCHNKNRIINEAIEKPKKKKKIQTSANKNDLTHVEHFDTIHFFLNTNHVNADLAQGQQVLAAVNCNMHHTDLTTPVKYCSCSR